MNTTIDPFGGGLNWWSSVAGGVAFCNNVIFPSRKEISTLPPRELSRFLRYVADSTPEVAAVRSVAVAQIRAYQFALTGGENVARYHDMLQIADGGDGVGVMMTRGYLDLIDSGWAVFGNAWRGATIADIYHIDAQYAAVNIGSIDKQRTHEQYPIVYESPTTARTYLERIGKNTEAWSIVGIPLPREAIAASNGKRVGIAVTASLYEEMRELSIARAVQNAHMTGEAVYKMVFTNAQRRQIDTADDSAKAATDNLTLKTGVMLYTDQLEKIEAHEIVLRNTMPYTDVAQLSRSLKIHACAVYGVNPMDVDPSLSGSGSLNDGTKAQVADDLRDGRLVAQYVKQFAVGLNTWVLPETISASFAFNDPRDEQRRISNMMQLINAMVAATSSGLLTTEAAQRVLRDEDVFDESVFNVNEQTVYETEQIAKSGETTLLTIKHKIFADQDNDDVVAELTKFGKTFVKALRKTVPSETGELENSIAFEVNDDGDSATMSVTAGNEARPGVVVRSTEFGRRGFGAKNGGTLAFEGSDGNTVFASHVNAAPAQAWVRDAFDAVSDEYATLLNSIGRSSVRAIQVGDVSVQNAPHIDGYNPSAKPTRKAKEIK